MTICENPSQFSDIRLPAGARRRVYICVEEFVCEAIAIVGTAPDALAESDAKPGPG
jgi:hypothetical protein